MNDIFLNVPYFNQRYGLWSFSADKYLMQDLPEKTIKGNNKVKRYGCGLCCTSMLLSWATGKIIDPLELTDRFYVNQGSSHVILWHEAKKLGLDTIMTNDINVVIEHLKLGHPALNIQGPGLFTSGGHFIALVGISADGLIAVNDPYSAARSYRRSGKLYAPKDIDKSTKKGKCGYTILIPESRNYKVHVRTSLNMWKNPQKEKKLGYLEDGQKLKVRAGSLQQKNGANFVPVRKTSGLKGFTGKYPAEGFSDIDYLYMYYGSHRL